MKLTLHETNETVDPDDIEALLVTELNELSFQEREKIYDELHGVFPETEETTELLETSLKAMDEALQHLPNRQIYEKAQQINPHYVEDRSFRLMFLRSEYFDPPKAATRLVKFLENKVKFFGEATLTRPIVLSDLNEDDMACLKSGIAQVIPVRDQSGRVVVGDFNMDDPNIVQPKTIDNYVRNVALVIVSVGIFKTGSYNLILACCIFFLVWLDTSLPDRSEQWSTYYLQSPKTKKHRNAA